MKIIEVIKVKKITKKDGIIVGLAIILLIAAGVVFAVNSGDVKENAFDGTETPTAIPGEILPSDETKTTIVDQLFGEDLSPTEALKEYVKVHREGNVLEIKRRFSSYAMKETEKQMARYNQTLEEFLAKRPMDYEIVEVISESPPVEATYFGQKYLLSTVKIKICMLARDGLTPGCAITQMKMARENGRWKFFGG